MDRAIKDRFAALWAKYFDGAELPIAFYYTDEAGRAELVKAGAAARCLIGELAKVRKGASLCFNVDSVGCPGGKRYLGFGTGEVMPNFSYFLSCGIPGKLEGERYKKSPELVQELMESSVEVKAPARFIVFKRWDHLEEVDDPVVVIFFAPPDVLAGLFTLANFDSAEPNAVFTPMGSGCSVIVRYPYVEKDAARPRGVLGMFDPSARPHVPSNYLTFAIPMVRFVTMSDNMEESFLITHTWSKIRERISRAEWGE